MSNYKRILAIGDLHGWYDGLIQALERANYDSQDDLLVQLGDIVDGAKQSLLIIHFFLQQEQSVLLRGNHDYYAYNFLKNRTKTYLEQWLANGGENTINEFMEAGILEDEEKCLQLVDFFERQQNYFIDENQNLYVHGGIGLYSSVSSIQDETVFFTDRVMWRKAKNGQYKEEDNIYNKVFIGHTALFRSSEKDTNPNALPEKYTSIWNLDTGAAWGGKVSIMDVEEENYFQSDFAPFSFRE